MTSAQVKCGLFLVAVQLCLLALTYGFNASMDRAAEQAGIAEIIKGE